jgi:Flp pilus assembly protein TadG
MCVRNNFHLKEKGQSLLEFSISFVIFIILMAGIIDLGRVFFTYMSLRDAAQEGAAYGSLNPMRVREIENRVRGISKNPLNFADPNIVDVFVSIEYTDGRPCASLDYKTDITVRVETRYTIIMPLMGTILGTQTIPIKASATDDILRPPCK